MDYQKLRDYYNIYRFLDDSGVYPPEDEALAETEASHYDHRWPPVHRTYEDGQWYYIVFKPFNKPYEEDKEWFVHKCVDSVTKWARSKSKTFYVTREIESVKVHGNLLLHSLTDLLKYQGKSCYNKYRMEVRLAPTLCDRLNVLTYMQKESLKRPFKKYLDYYGTM